MTRVAQLLKYVNIDGIGIEIAPYFNPILRKSDGYNIFIIDIFDTDTLIRNAKNDPLIQDNQISNIERVDFVGSAVDIATLVSETGLSGKIDFIISSHNFEHLPDPIRFLQGCCHVLAPGGVLSMAIPDFRACFDHFRFPTTLADWLEAFFERRQQPTSAQIFAGNALRSQYFIKEQGEPVGGYDLYLQDPENYRVLELLEPSFVYWRENINNSVPPYVDTHCSVLFNKIFELLITDLRFLNIINLEIIEISNTLGHEFFVHLKKPSLHQATLGVVDGKDFYKQRNDLLLSVHKEIAQPLEKSKITNSEIPFSGLNVSDLRGPLTEAVNRQLTILKIKSILPFKSNSSRIKYNKKIKLLESVLTILHSIES